MRSVPAIAALAAAWALAGAATAAAAVPHSFVGVVADSPLVDSPQVKLEPELDAMAGAGVRSIRLVVDWSAAQPYRDWSEVPGSQTARFRDEGGVPTDYSVVDAVVG